MPALWRTIPALIRSRPRRALTFAGVQEQLCGELHNFSLRDAEQRRDDHDELPLTNATQTITGKVVDAANPSLGLPGLLVPASGETNGWFTVAFTDTNGNFTIGTRPDLWKIEKNETGAAAYGYVVTQSSEKLDTSTGSVAGVTISYPKATALFYGTVKDALNNPLAGVAIDAFDNNQYETSTRTDQNGRYTIGALCGDTWQAQISSDINPAFTNYIFSQPAINQNGGTNIPCGPAASAQANVTGLLATNRITGHIQQNNGQPVPVVQVFATAVIGGTFYVTAADTDGSGNYSLNVANGNWSVSVSCQGGQDSLDAILGNGNYQCPSSQNASVSNNNGTANFTVLPCGGIQILTSSPLPNGQVGVYYSNQFNASSCNGNFSWSLNSGNGAAWIESLLRRCIQRHAHDERHVQFCRPRQRQRRRFHEPEFLHHDQSAADTPPVSAYPTRSSKASFNFRLTDVGPELHGPDVHESGFDELDFNLRDKSAGQLLFVLGHQTRRIPRAFTRYCSDLSQAQSSGDLPARDAKLIQQFQFAPELRAGNFSTQELAIFCNRLRHLFRRFVQKFDTEMPHAQRDHSARRIPRRSAPAH